MRNHINLRFVIVFCVLAATAMSRPVVARQPNQQWQESGYIGVMDPNPDLLNKGAIITDEVKILNYFYSDEGQAAQRDGAAADGVTKVLLFYNTTRGKGETVEFCIKDGDPKTDGGLSTVSGNSQSSCVTATTVERYRGDEGSGAFAVYTAPQDFNAGSDTDKTERIVKLRARFNPEPGIANEANLDFKLVRPPLVMIHGIWSNPGTWRFAIARDQRYVVELADYQQTNAQAFQVNLGVPRISIDRALERMRDRKFAATQVDVIAHSMGGILTRFHIGMNDYKRNENFNQGDVHALLTLNTPHTGSPYATALVQQQGTNLAGLMARAGRPIDQGAVDDLAVGSAALRNLPTTNVPSHALIRIGGRAHLAAQTQLGWAAWAFSWWGPNVAEIFGNEEHDTIVTERSQAGGIAAGAQSVFNGDASIHTEVTGSQPYSNRLIELTNTRTQANDFGAFPSGRLVQMNQALLRQAQLQQSGTQDLIEDLTITSPISGSQVVAGTRISVTLTAPTGITLARVLLVGPETGISSTHAAVLALPIPINALGNYSIVAFGFEPSGALHASKPLLLRVVTTATLAAMSVFPTNGVATSLRDQQQTTIFGRFSDGIVRDISGSSTGTLYQSSRPTVTQISSAGQLSPQALGTTVLTITYGSSAITTTFTVISRANQIPVAFAGYNANSSPNTRVTLSGVGSFDPDAGPAPLSYSWQQTSGHAITLTGSLTQSVVFTPTTMGVYAFQLVVSDGLTSSLPSQVVVIVGDALNRKTYLPVLFR